MRLTYLTIPLFAVMLAGCGDDDPDTVLPVEGEVPAEEAYGTPTDADQSMTPMDDTPAPSNESMPPAEDPMAPEGDNLRRSLDPDPGLGVDRGGSPNERIDPGVDRDTTTAPRGDGL